MTVATCVCCSITSEIHTRYGVRSLLPRQVVAALAPLPVEQAGRERDAHLTLTLKPFITAPPMRASVERELAVGLQCPERRQAQLERLALRVDAAADTGRRRACRRSARSGRRRPRWADARCGRADACRRREAAATRWRCAPRPPRSPSRSRRCRRLPDRAWRAARCRRRAALRAATRRARRRARRCVGPRRRAARRAPPSRAAPANAAFQAGSFTWMFSASKSRRCASNATSTTFGSGVPPRRPFTAMSRRLKMSVVARPGTRRRTASCSVCQSCFRISSCQATRASVRFTNATAKRSFVGFWSGASPSRLRSAPPPEAGSSCPARPRGAGR